MGSSTGIIRKSETYQPGLTTSWDDRMILLPTGPQGAMPRRRAPRRVTLLLPPLFLLATSQLPSQQLLRRGGHM